eukprot:TRINITY_DN39583_c0_g1_i1.p1 TRINITY_DN39583_c0_g1~~TRINITY_DN39583_c0_g1_i1.p1  ORF type:complete len:247 (+),score=11.31 TRINITY_DN39583_c0_g1_i1:110-850(+)
MGNPMRNRQAASSTIAVSPVECFFDTTKCRPDYCCTGLSHVLEALKLYSVKELLVAVDTKAPAEFAGLSPAAAWQALAQQHKATLQIVQPDTSLGKKFCKGVVVGALLSRAIDHDLMESLMEPWSHEVMHLPRSVSAASPTAGLQCHRRCRDSERKTQLFPRMPLSPRQEFFLWLRGSLQAELNNECCSESLLACAEVLLQSVEDNSQDIEEVVSALLSAAEVLRDEGAVRSADSLPAHWYAIVQP